MNWLMKEIAPVSHVICLGGRADQLAWARTTDHNNGMSPAVSQRREAGRQRGNETGIPGSVSANTSHCSSMRLKVVSRELKPTNCVCARTKHEDRFRSRALRFLQASNCTVCELTFSSRPERYVNVSALNGTATPSARKRGQQSVKAGIRSKHGIQTGLTSGRWRTRTWSST